MSATLQKIFPVLPEERGKVIHFALFAALLQAGVAIGMTAADSLFLSHLGAGRLPIVYLCMPIVMAAYAPIYSFLLARLGIDRIVPLTLAALTIGGIAFGTMSRISGEQAPWFLFAGKFYAGMWFIALYTLFWNFTDAYFSVRDGKRLYGIVAAGASLGGTVGAALVAWLTRLLSPPQLYFAWSICALAAYPVYVRLRRRFQPIEAEDHEDAEKATPGDVLRVVFETFRKSRFALGVTVLCFAAVGMTGMLEFLAMGVLSEGRSATQLAGLLGELQAIAQVTTLVINLVLFGRVVGRLGVANTALILPLAYASAFLFLHLHTGSVAAIAAFYAYQTILPGIEYNNVNLLFNAVPARAKALLRTFVEAMTEPLATAAAGLFLFSLAARLGSASTALVGVFVAGGALAIALLTRARYVDALAENLRRDWLNFADTKRDWGEMLSDADRAQLRERARLGTRGEQRVAADLLWRARDLEAGPALFHLLSTAQPGEVPKLRPAITAVAEAEDPEIVTGAMLWLDGAERPTDPEVVDELTAAGIVPLSTIAQYPTWDSNRGSVAPMPRSRSLAALGAVTAETARQLILGTAPERRWAIRAIGEGKVSFPAGDLLRFALDRDGAVRLETLRSLGKLATRDQAEWVGRVLPLVRTATTEEFHLIVRLAACVSDARAIAGLLRAAEHRTAAELRELESMLVGQGGETVPVLLEVLRDASVQHSARSVAVRAVSRLDVAALLRVADDLFRTELREAEWRTAAAKAVTSLSKPGSPAAQLVLARHYHDAAIESLDFTLELLSRTGRLPDYDLIRASLAFANAKDRANAIETIQQSCPRDTFDRILRIIEQTSAPAAPAKEPESLPELDVIRECAIRSVDPIERAAANLLFGRVSGIPADAERIERIAALLRCSWFGRSRIRTLDYLAERATRRVVPDGEVIYDRGDAVDPVLYVVATGTVDLDRANKRTTIGIGGVFGERVLMLDATRHERARSRGAELLALPAAAITRAIEVFPMLGISLYQMKTISAVS